MTIGDLKPRPPKQMGDSFSERLKQAMCIIKTTSDASTEIDNLISKLVYPKVKVKENKTVRGNYSGWIGKKKYYMEHKGKDF